MIDMKTIYNTIKVACVGMLTMAMTSCLDFSPESQMNDKTVWSSATNFQLFANQFYSYTRDIQAGDANGYQYAVSDGPHSDTRSDLMAEANVNVYSQGTNTIPERDKNYSSLYTHIYYTNLLLKNAAGYADQKAIAVPVAEAKFFRAYSYFELVQLYGNVILLTEPVDMDSPAMNAARDDRGLVIDQCIKDLKEAAEGLPETASEAGRLCKDAANAYLSRVALYEATWQKFHNGGANATSNSERVTSLLTIAKNAAKAVMDGGRFKLFYNEKLGTESYRYMFILEDAQCNPAGLTTKDNTEYILARRHKSTDGVALNITKAYLMNAVYPTRKLANLYVCQDGLPIEKSPLFKGYDKAVSEFQNRDNRMLTTLTKRGDKVWDNTTDHCRTAWDESDESRAKSVSATANSGYQTHKWAVERQVADKYETMDYPVIRYAEVLLNYAEATFKYLGSADATTVELPMSARQAVNVIRNRQDVKMPELAEGLNNDEFWKKYENERMVELAFEGHRFYDVRRWKEGSKLASITEMKITKNEDGTFTYKRNVVNRGWDDKMYFFPISKSELLKHTNPDFKQNPGW